MERDQESVLLGRVAWDGNTATSERVLLKASVANRRLVGRNLYVRIQDEEGDRTGFLARILSGPFFHRSGAQSLHGPRNDSKIASVVAVAASGR